MRPELAPWLQNFISTGEWSEWRDSNPGPLVPNQMRYQAALHSDVAVCMGLREVNQAHIEP